LFSSRYQCKCRVSHIYIKVINFRIGGVTVKIIGISGTLVGSKTKIITEILLNEVKNQHPEFEVDMVDLKNFSLDFCDGRPLSQYNEETQGLISKLEKVDGYVLGTTIMHGSIPGALKNLFDLVPPSIFEGKPIVLVANGGNPEHSLAIEKHLKPITDYLKMKNLANYVFVTSKDFNLQNEMDNPDIQEQIRCLAKEYGELLISAAN